MELDDIIDNPTRYGMPTFDEFCKNRDHYLKNWKLNDEAVFDSADLGSVLNKKRTKEHWYYYGMHKSKKLYDCVKAIQDDGISFDDVTYIVAKEETTAGKFIFHIKFFPKEIVNHGRDDVGTDAHATRESEEA